MPNENPLPYQPTSAPPTLAPAGTGVAGGFDPAYKAPDASPGSGYYLPGSDTMTPWSSINTFRAADTPQRQGKGLYLETDAWGPLRNPAGVPELQKKLVEAGLLSPKDVRLGVWDNASAAAYKTVLATANAYSATATDTLNYLVQNPQLGSPTAKPGPYSVTNPTDVKQGYLNAVEQLTGGSMSPAADAFVKQFQNQETTANAAQAQATLAGKTDYTAAPSPIDAAMQWIRDHNPDQVKAYDMASRMTQFFNDLSSVNVPKAPT